MLGLRVQNEAGQRLSELCPENALVIQTPSSNNTRDDSPHGHHHMVTTKIRLIIFFVAKDGEALHRQKKTKQQEKKPGADCGSDHELNAKFRLKLKKVGKTTRPFRYDLNRTSYDYTVEVTSKVKVLDLIDRVSEEPWIEIWDIAQEAVIKTIHKKKKC